MTEGGAASSFTEFDRQCMARALELAAHGLETTHPNPRVGCVITRDEKIVGEGWHEWPGEAHAEVHALQVAGDAARGATAYVTLEPCSHHGRTPPCVDALIKARIARVVFATYDPNPSVNGRGERALKEAGIQIVGGLLTDEAAGLNAGFIKRMRQGLPFVRLKTAMSLDGRTALANGQSQWISSEAARADVQHWRARSSAVLTGVGTVLADDPRLNVRLPGARRRQPLRVVLDSQLRTPATAKLFEAPGKISIFSALQESDRAVSLRQTLEDAGAFVVNAPANGRVDLRAVLERLAKLQMNEVLVEAGPILSGAFITAALVDELLIYLAPVLLGPQARALAELPLLQELAGAPGFKIIDTEMIGPDLRLRLKPQ